LASLATIVLFDFKELAVVAEFATFPAVAIVANLVSAIAAVGEILAFVIVLFEILAAETARFAIFVVPTVFAAILAPVIVAFAK
jgi:hypothetical protein